MDDLVSILIGIDASILGWLVLVILSLNVAFFDLTNRVVSNRTCLLILVIAVFINSIGYDSIFSVNGLLAAFFLFFLYYISFWGGGDTKLAIAFLPAITAQYVLLFLVGIGLLGGVLLVVYLIVGLRCGVDKIKEDGLPFGIPICISGLFCVVASL